MARARAKIEVKVEVLSLLHVGSGLDCVVNSVRGADGENKAPRVAAIQRDAAGAPWLPGSTIKGLLRRLSADMQGEFKFDSLLGSVTKRGTLIISGGSLHEPGDAKFMPYADKPANPGPDVLGPGVFVAAGTRINGATGVAESSSLRHKEAVAPGAVFPLSFTIEARGAGAETERDDQLNALVAILSRLRAPSGQAIGAGQADGDGRILLKDDKLRVVKMVLGAQGEWQRTSLDISIPEYHSQKDSIRRWSLILECEGPFAVLDPSWAQMRVSRDGSAAVRAQRSAEKSSAAGKEGLPVLPGSSVAGALRARAAWILALDAHRKGKPLITDDPPLPYEAIKHESYTPVQRLFGMTGYRGMLAIESLVIDQDRPLWSVFSVKLDRFSGGPMSGGLFETETFLNVKATLVLRLCAPAGKEIKKEDENLADELIADLCKNGITLGHGINKGFGWFTVRRDGEYANV